MPLNFFRSNPQFTLSSSSPPLSSFFQIGTSASRWARSDGPSRPVSRWSCAAPSTPRTFRSVSSRCRGSSAAHRWPWWTPVPCLSWDRTTWRARPPATWPSVRTAPTCTCSSCSTCGPKTPASTSAGWRSARRRPRGTSLTAARGHATSRSPCSHSVSQPPAAHCSPSSITPRAMSFCVIASLSSYRQDGDVALRLLLLWLSVCPSALPPSVWLPPRWPVWDSGVISECKGMWVKGRGAEICYSRRIFCSSGFGDASLCVFTDFLNWARKSSGREDVSCAEGGKTHGGIIAILASHLLESNTLL